MTMNENNTNHVNMDDIMNVKVEEGNKKGSQSGGSSDFKYDDTYINKMAKEAS